MTSCANNGELGSPLEQKPTEQTLVECPTNVSVRYQQEGTKVPSTFCSEASAFSQPRSFV